MKKYLYIVFVLLFALFALPLTVKAEELINPTVEGDSWNVYHIEEETGYIWHIQKLDFSGDISFPFNQSGISDRESPFNNQFSISTTGLDGYFTPYLKRNYSTDITGKTIKVKMSVFAEDGLQFFTRSTACENDGDDAYVRLQFQSATGTYDSNDYWWSTGENSINLSELASLESDELEVSTVDFNSWSNICGKLASDGNVYTGPDCIGGTYPDISPKEGFENALKNIKQIGVAFGSQCRYASGVAVDNGNGEYRLNEFIVE